MKILKLLYFNKFFYSILLIDYNIKDREKVYEKIYDEIKSKYNDYKINITLDIDVSD